MGEAADRKVKEIEQTRERLARDLGELEARLPAPLRSTKAILGTAVGGSTIAGLSGMILRRRAKRRADDRTTEVVVRVVRDDLEPAVDGRRR